jgi:hypothetical protein
VGRYTFEFVYANGLGGIVPPENPLKSTFFRLFFARTIHFSIQSGRYYGVTDETPNRRWRREKSGIPASDTCSNGEGFFMRSHRSTQPDPTSPRDGVNSEKRGFETETARFRSWKSRKKKNSDEAQPAGQP